MPSNILTSFLNYFGTRKVLSSSDSTHLPNVFLHRNPRVFGRTASRLHAAKSAARLQRHGSIASAATGSTSSNTNPAGTGTAHKPKPRGTKYRQARMHSLAGEKPLQRSNAIFVPQVPTHPQPPGALVVEPSFIVPNFPTLDDRNLPPIVTHKIFFDALVEGRQAILSASAERGLEECDEDTEDTDYARRLQQVMEQVHDARRRWEDEENRILVEELRQQAEKDRISRLMEEGMRKKSEARYRVLLQEFQQRQAEQESIERERREEERRQNELREKHLERERLKAERLERERLEAERLEQERLEAERQEQEQLEAEHQEHEAAPSDPLTQVLIVYENKWAVLRNNPGEVKQLGFYNMPWPSFVPIGSADTLTKESVETFMRHLGHFQDKKWTTIIRSELLRWHPDKFEGQLFGKVIDADREGVWKAVLAITRILNDNLNNDL